MLSTKEQLEFCKKCEKRASDLKVGIVCSLTNEKPNFGASCPDYVLDPAEAIKEQIRAETKAQEKEDLKALPGNIIAIIIAVVIAAVIAFIKFGIRSSIRGY